VFIADARRADLRFGMAFAAGALDLAVLAQLGYIMRKIFSIAAVVLAGIVIFAFRLVLLALGSLLYVYLLPWVVAQKRGHPREREILLACVFTAWLVLPWAIALWIARKGGTESVLGAPVLAWNAFDE
jgi:hypothetical protein